MLYQEFRTQVGAVVAQVHAYEAIPSGYRPIAEMRRLYAPLLRLMLTEVTDAPEGFAWGKDPTFTLLGEVRSLLSRLINEQTEGRDRANK